ncbi:MAG TPA: glutaminase [Hyphomicrobiales bacterium]|nr:glutaminase [Hyphomicrobiales bacterium]
MSFEQILQALPDYVSDLHGKGKVASYIPALARVPAQKFGVSLHTLDGRVHCVGDSEERFSIQSISKVFTLSLAMNMLGEELWRRVGREPSGNRFNSLVQLEYEQGIPRNPFINAGAIVLCDILLSHLHDPKQALLDYLRVLTGNPEIGFDEEVARSEHETGFINRSLANFLKGNANLHNEVEAVLDLYFHQCALALSCSELARATLHLANGGHSPSLNESLLTASQVKRINALMLTCGLYDAVGEFAYRVGLPAKSGVGGGIVAVLPGEYAVAVWSPELDPSGNSLAGGAALEYLTLMTGRSVF